MTLQLLGDFYCPRDMDMGEWRQRFQSYADSFSLSANIPTMLAKILLCIQLQELLIAGPIVPDALHVALQRAINIAKAQQLSLAGHETPAAS
jgi:hypothetical protein